MLCGHLKLENSLKSKKGISFQRIWKTWPSLDYLDVRADEDFHRFEIKWDENFDHIFCGIHPDPGHPTAMQEAELLDFSMEGDGVNNDVEEEFSWSDE